MEPKDGDGADKSHRLPSFSGPRALKINTAPSRVTVPGRRVFAPNLAVSRDVSDGGVKKEGGGDSKRNQGQPYPQRRKDDKRGGHNSRGGKREFRKTELLQSEGAIFEEGVGTKSLSDRKMATKVSSSIGASSFRGQMSSVKSKDAIKKDDIKKPGHSRMETDGLLTEDDYYSPRMIPMSAEDISPLLKQLELSSTSGTLMLFRVPGNLPLMQEQEVVDDAAAASSKLVSDIASFPEGPIGSIEFPCDGAITLTVGENEFSIEPGTHAEFHQEVLLVNDDNLISMGPVRHKYICRTNIETLISSQPI